MEFNKAYNRQDFVKFLQNSFLPNDYIPSEEEVLFRTQMKYSTEAVKLGTCESLDLVVYEVKHSSKNDARVSLSKEAFRMLADESKDRALVVFVPEDSNANYRFSFIEITLDIKEDSSKVSYNYSNPRRYSYFLGEGIAYYTPNKYLNEKGRVVSKEDLLSRFSVEVLTKEFYQELSDWYAWAIKIIRFPNDINDKEDDAKFNNEGAIRLITRLIFVWFLKQRNLIPNEFFDEKYIADNLLNDFAPNRQTGLFMQKSLESKYYKAILQNLFFAMLNSPITAEGSKEMSERHFRKGQGDYDNNKLMRYEYYFQNPQLFVDLANTTVPFLNGGLFDCLDDKDNGMYYDGFSDRETVRKSLVVPDFLFFGEEAGKNIDLSEWYGDKKKKKVSARGIIDILKRYNFTVEENTPFDKEVSLDPELLGKVFENLLASFNPETQTTARKQTGSFYTPREIVQYMVDESLIAHLKRTVGEELEPQYRQLMQYSDDEVELSSEQRKNIMQSLYNCKILDPACGSGAFPMGILQQMVHILNRIDSNNEMWREMMYQRAISDTSDAYRNSSDEERKELVKDIERSFDESINRPDYARKLYLIENCIYGVDIQPIAIQISKLRFFISLVVDQNTNTDPTDNFGIRPLPNLEAKFVAANTLIGLQKKDASLFDSEAIKAKENELKIAKHKIFGAKTVRTKRKYRQIVNDLRLEIATLLKENGAVGNDEARELASWDMFDQNSSSPFFDPEWMFGVKDGFDIVIGNPPYVQLQANDGALGTMYEKLNYETFVRTGDIYSLFYERGYQLLVCKGHLCYITSNKWMRAAYGEKTRKFFAEKTNPKVLIDFAGVKIFESATVDTNILLFSKEKNEGKTIGVLANKLSKNSINNLSVFVQQNASEYNFNSLDSWVILSPIEQSIKRKIEAIGTPLKDWDINIYRGILTGYNDAFIISTEKRNEILDNCQTEDERTRTAELIRPILRGRDIKRYGYDWADLWIINTHNGIKGKLTRVDVNEYPAIKAHLDQYWDKISKRTDKGDTPYNLRNCAYMEDFFKPKIIFQEIVQSSQFFYDEHTNYMCNDTGRIIVGEHLPFILGILNSKIFFYAVKKYYGGGILGEHGIRMKHTFFGNFPCLPYNKNIEDIAKELSIQYNSSLADKLEDIINSAYSFTKDEILEIQDEII
ncbi:Eco57I restriction-modification methylase domain-containing protein [uncultured Bacteroides sp.]|uniref:Eco57I restriction-modification methylase domain-containing protein n=1 Tax=uncultured Bacteroides sp. TaxID=162156 RepID=UPI0026058A97|nr:Eco57I restriction-modification methylase domain-containing protein [uncultured Bacteroides sp.]